MGTRTRIALAGLLLGAALAGGVAWATIPSADGTIHGCYKTNKAGENDPNKGQLRVVDSASDCKSNETAISWNEKGIAGAAGAVGAAGPTGPQGAKSGPDLSLIATLRWDQADRAYGDFAVGSSPRGVAFDGSSVWVANLGSDNVTKLRASDGTSLGTFAAGTAPFAVAFDGSSVWVANIFSNDVTKLRASDGTALGTFAVGTFPRGVAFDGSSVWVANGGSDNVTKLRASDGTALGTFAVGTNPRGVAFDGSSIWVVNGGSNTVSKRTG